MTTSPRVAELDFDLIKENFKTFLRTKPEFTDYDYEGSGLSVLMDLLAYNTHYNAVVGNMMIQELYLDTAVKKQSLGLIAKRLNYVPKSYRAPKAVVSVEVFPYDAPDTLTLGKNAKFSVRLNSNVNAVFVTREARVINRSVDGRYVFDDVELFEGDNATFRYLVSNPATQRFEIPSRLVDTSLLKVFVQQSTSNTEIEEWKNYSSLVDVTGATKSYFIKLNENLNYEVYFGDDVIGKSIVPGNIVVLDYVTTNGPVANNATRFTFTDSINGYSNIVVTTKTPAFGGALPETNDSIRRNAQNTVLMQNRAVTGSDYAQIVSQLLPIETIAVYGGETVSPPQYGKVFISAKLLGTTESLLESQKQLIIKEIKKRSVLSIGVEFIDPEYTYMIIDTQVKIDQKRTTASIETLKTKIFNAIKTYGSERLNKFDSSFEYSNLVGYIDDIDRCIMSNDTKIRLRKSVDLLFNSNIEYKINFDTALIPSNSREQTIISSAFRTLEFPDVDLYLQDTGGIIQFYTVEGMVKHVLNENAGTIDYESGMIKFTATTILSDLNTLSIEVVPSNKNVLFGRNNIITLTDQDIQIRTIVT